MDFKTFCAPKYLLIPFFHDHLDVPHGTLETLTERLLCGEGDRDSCGAGLGGAGPSAAQGGQPHLTLSLFCLPTRGLRSPRSSRQAHYLHGLRDLRVRDLDSPWERWVPDPVLPCGVQEAKESGRLDSGHQCHPSLPALCGDHRPGER